MVDMLVQQLADPRFHHVNFELVRFHVPSLRNLSVENLKAAVKRDKDATSVEQYQQPHVSSVLKYLDGEGHHNQSDLLWLKLESMHNESARRSSSLESSSMPLLPTEEQLATLIELRKLFIQLMRASYEEKLVSGALDGRHGVLTYVLLESLDSAFDSASKGQPLNDWVAMGIRVNPQFWGERLVDCADKIQSQHFNLRHAQLRFAVQCALMCAGAHGVAQERFQEEFGCEKDDLSDEEKLMSIVVLQESHVQLGLALKSLEAFPSKEVECIVSHLLCTILLNKSALFIEMFSREGFLKEKEASVFLDEIEEALRGTARCSSH